VRGLKLERISKTEKKSYKGKDITNNPSRKGRDGRRVYGDQTNKGTASVHKYRKTRTFDPKSVRKGLFTKLTEGNNGHPSGLGSPERVEINKGE